MVRVVEGGVADVGGAEVEGRRLHEHRVAAPVELPDAARVDGPGEVGVVVVHPLGYHGLGAAHAGAGPVDEVRQVAARRDAHPLVPGAGLVGHDAQRVAPDDREPVLDVRQPVDGGRPSVLALVVAEMLHGPGGGVVAEGLDVVEHPGGAVGEGDVQHLKDALERLVDAIPNLAAEVEDVCERAVGDVGIDAEWVRYLDVAAPPSAD